MVGIVKISVRLSYIKPLLNAELQLKARFNVQFSVYGLSELKKWVDVSPLERQGVTSIGAGSGGKLRAETVHSQTA